MFVIDGERVYIFEPRNEAALYLIAARTNTDDICWWRHVESGCGFVPRTHEGRRLFVIEMLDANHFLTGVGWRNNYPRDARNVFASLSQEYLDTMQALFQGKTEYREVARFSEGYFMPE